MTNACAMWDFRVSADDLASDLVLEQLRKIAKRYTFQLEKGNTTGYLHYQGRMSLIKKHRKSELMEMFDIIPVPNYLEPTVDSVAKKGDMFYVMKDETRVEGPWTERDQEKFIPLQYQGMLPKLYPYQKAIYDSGLVFDTRTINMLYCPYGNIGKSTIASVSELFANGIDLPPVNDAEKIVQSACDICMAKRLRSPSPIFIDMPRAMNKERLNGIYTAIEQIKKGKLYDLRHTYKDWWINSPTIWVFSNIEPEFDLLSRDRWKVWIVDENKQLQKYVPGGFYDSAEIQEE